MTSHELRAWRIRNFGAGHGSRTQAAIVLGISRWSEWRFERGGRPIPPGIMHLAVSYEASPEERQILESLAQLWTVSGRRPAAEERLVTDPFARLRRARA